MAKKKTEVDKLDEIEFYSESKSFTDGQDWERRQKKLVPQNSLGSIIDLKESWQNPRMARIANMHNKYSRSIEDSEKNQILNRYNYLNTNFHWLEEYIPANKLDQIIQLMAYSRTQKKISKELAGLNLKDLALILAFWELDVYPLGNYIVEEVLQDINDYLRSYSNNFMLRGIISIKDIQMSQELILSDLYALEYGKTSRTFSKLPKEALTYYRGFLHSFEEDLPIAFAQKIEKARSKRPDLVIPSSVYIWVIRKKLLQSMLPFLVTKLGIGQVDFLQIQLYAENFWNNVFHQKAIGDLPTVGYLLIETWQEANNKSLPIRLTSLHKVEKFKTRIKAYRRRFSELMVAALPKELQKQHKERVKFVKRMKLEEDYRRKQQRIDGIKSQINRIQEWLDQFSSIATQKLLKRSATLRKTFDENQEVMERLQQELETLEESLPEQGDDRLADYRTIQTLLLESFVEIIDIYQSLIVSSSAKLLTTNKLLQLEEHTLPSLMIQVQMYKNHFDMIRSIDVNRKEVQDIKQLIKQVDQQFKSLNGALKQKIEDQINFHLINDPLSNLPKLS